MTDLSVHYSSKTDDWATPQAFFDKLHAEFHFTLDPCATAENTKCSSFITESQDGLKQPWGKEIVFMNPPYGRAIRDWVEKAYRSSLTGATVVCLIPSRTDTSYWHDFIFGKAEVRFVRGRLKFSGAVFNAPFPNAVVIFRPLVSDAGMIDLAS
jgi:phage N-6-adenine-methyltransferase